MTTRLVVVLRAALGVRAQVPPAALHVAQQQVLDRDGALLGRLSRAAAAVVDEAQAAAVDDEVRVLLGEDHSVGVEAGFGEAELAHRVSWAVEVLLWVLLYLLPRTWIDDFSSCTAVIKRFDVRSIGSRPSIDDTT